MKKKTERLVLLSIARALSTKQPLARERENSETLDAHTMLAQLKSVGVLIPVGPGGGSLSPEALAIVKRWLRKHWSDGWTAAGGPSGAPVPEAKKGKGRKP